MSHSRDWTHICPPKPWSRSWVLWWGLGTCVGKHVLVPETGSKANETAREKALCWEALENALQKRLQKCVLGTKPQQISGMSYLRPFFAAQEPTMLQGPGTATAGSQTLRFLRFSLSTRRGEVSQSQKGSPPTPTPCQQCICRASTCSEPCQSRSLSHALAVMKTSRHFQN